jgi:DNA-binding NtrC family response regulator
LKRKILAIDDDRDLCALLSESLSKEGYEVTTATTAAEAYQSMTAVPYDLLVVDVELGDESGLALCGRAIAERPDVPVIVMTAFGSMESAIAALRAGAYDFVNKPLRPEALALCIRRALQDRSLREEVRRLREQTQPVQSVEGIVGDSQAISRVVELVQRVAPTDASVLISGESGTGKELIARALHFGSVRKEHPFVAVNCAAVPSTLLESELFGHVRGAFTDAKTTRRGLFVEADGGTLFLDEISEMALDMQTKLLRALQERRVRPVGGSAEVGFNTRIVAATNRDLEADVVAGTFRQDLFYRIDVVHVRIPPLRGRGNDVLLLAQHFLQKIAARLGKPVTGLSTEVAARLLEYDWPGNVRELENSIERAVALTPFDKLTVDDLPERIRDRRASTIAIEGDDPELLPTLKEVERRYIERVIKMTGGNKTQAARILGLERRTLYRRLARLGTDRHDPSGQDDDESLGDDFDEGVQTAEPVEETKAVQV